MDNFGVYYGPFGVQTGVRGPQRRYCRQRKQEFRERILKRLWARSWSVEEAQGGAEA